MKKHTEISYLKGIGIIAVVLGHTNASNTCIQKQAV